MATPYKPTEALKEREDGGGSSELIISRLDNVVRLELKFPDAKKAEAYKLWIEQSGKSGNVRLSFCTAIEEKK